MFLWAPLRHSAKKLWDWARSRGLDPQAESSQDCLILTLDTPSEQLGVLGSQLTAEERRSTRALFKEGSEEPGFGDFSRVVSLEELIAWAESGWLIDLLAKERMTSFFQPLVRSSDPSQVVAHEALLRGLGETGEILPPGRMLGAAKATGLLFQMDRAARMTAIREFVHCDLSSLIFINFIPTAIYDPVNCLASTVKLIHEIGLPPQRVVFEVVESEEVNDLPHLANIMRFYREAGFGIALDDLGSGYGSLNLLSELRPDYVKLDMGLVRGVDNDPFKAIVADRLLGMARDLGVKTVVEGVETKEELAWSQEHGADLIQGYLLAKPANPPHKPNWPQ